MLNMCIYEEREGGRRGGGGGGGECVCVWYKKTTGLDLPPLWEVQS